MRFYEIINEGYQRDKTLKNFGSRLEMASKRERHQISPEDILSKLEAADPSRKKAFVINLVSWYIDGTMNFVEDATKATKPLELYAKFKNRNLPALGSMSFDQLLDLGDQLNDVKSGKDLDREKDDNFITSGQAKIIKNTSEWKVLEIHSEDAAKHFGVNTRWCTASDNHNAFHQYYKPNDPIFILINKPKNKRYQIHFGTWQIRNELDKTVSLETAHTLLYDVAPELWNDKNQNLALQGDPVQDDSEANYPPYALIDDLRPEQRKMILSRGGECLRWLKDITDQEKRIRSVPTP